MPVLILYFLHPNSFEAAQETWKGRTFYLFFLWLIILELILNWEKLLPKIVNLWSLRTVAFAIALFLPTVYVVGVNFFGLESAVVGMVDLFGLPFVPLEPHLKSWVYVDWVFTLEYLIFTVLFAVLVWLEYGKNGLKDFSISLFFIGAIGAVYMIDIMYPYGYFTPFQIFVPFTASLAGGVLNLIGYQTSFEGQKLGAPILQVRDSFGRPLVGFAIGWPCAGVQSLLIYTFVMLVFFKKATIPLSHKIVYFVVGALITYSINVLRIVSIYLIYINNLSISKDAAEQAAKLFHNYYGGLFSMAWIIAYPLIIIGSRMLWTKIKQRQSLTT